MDKQTWLLWSMLSIIFSSLGMVSIAGTIMYNGLMVLQMVNTMSINGNAILVGMGLFIGMLIIIVINVGIEHACQYRGIPTLYSTSRYHRHQ